MIWLVLLSLGWPVAAVLLALLLGRGIRIADNAHLAPHTPTPRLDTRIR